MDSYSKDYAVLKAILFILIVLFLSITFVAKAVESHSSENGAEVFVRVIDANPDTKEYTFSCSKNPEEGYLRDWFIRPDGESEEATFLDVPAGENLTYVFEEDKFYHIGCLIVDESDYSTLYRGDMHIDLRNSLGNPEVIPVSGNGLSAELECKYEGSGDNANWEILNAQTGEVHHDSGKNIVYTAEGHGLYDVVCRVNTDSGVSYEAGLPLEFFDEGDPYFPDKYGVPDGVENVWVRDGSDGDGNETDGDGILDEGLNRIDRGGGLEVKYSCKPEGSSDALVVDWNYGDGNSVYDIDEITTHNYVEEGNYYVQCDVWDNANSKFTSLSNNFDIDSTTVPGDGNETTPPEEGNETGGEFSADLSVINKNGLSVEFMCDHNAQGDYNIDWFGNDGENEYTLSLDEAKKEFSYTFGSEGNYFVTCGVWSNELNKYVDDNINVMVGSDGVGDVNETLSAPVWTSHTEAQDVAPHYFHIELNQPSDISLVQSTDFEVWKQDDLVWQEYNATGSLRFHTHTPDGKFVGIYSGRSELEYSTEYKVRAKYYSENGYTGWSEWKYFTTMDEQTGSQEEIWNVVDGYYVEKFAEGFDVPVQIAEAPNLYGHLPENERPELYVTELYGKIKVVYADGSQKVYAENLLNFDPFGSITGGGQMGVVGLYVDPENGDLYVGMVYLNENDELRNKVVRFYTNSGGDGYTSSEILIDDLPSASSHQVEQITKGPDGKIYVNLGDALTSNYAQNDSILAGKIIRMDTDGSDVEIYAKGFRNPFGADWSENGVLYVTDNAPDVDDKVTRVLERENYGWGMNDNFSTFNEKRIYTTEVSPVDVAFSYGDGFFNQYGKLYIAVAGPVYTEGPVDGKHVIELTLDSNGEVVSDRVFANYVGDGYGTPIGLEFAEGNLYFTDIYGEAGFTGLGESEGRIYRIVPGESDCVDCGVGGEFRVALNIKKWYPKDTGDGIEYIFECRGIEGSGDYMYNFYFGDGEKNLDTSWNTQYHKYPYGDVNYDVKCVVEDQVNHESVEKVISVNPDDYLEEKQ